MQGRERLGYQSYMLVHTNFCCSITYKKVRDKWSNASEFWCTMTTRIKSWRKPEIEDDSILKPSTSCIACGDVI